MHVEQWFRLQYYRIVCEVQNQELIILIYKLVTVKISTKESSFFNKRQRVGMSVGRVFKLALLFQ